MKNVLNFLCEPFNCAAINFLGAAFNGAMLCSAVNWNWFFFLGLIVNVIGFAINSDY